MQDQATLFHRGDHVEQLRDGVTRRGVVASVGWSGCLGDVLVIHFDDNPCLTADVVVPDHDIRLLETATAA